MPYSQPSTSSEQTWKQYSFACKILVVELCREIDICKVQSKHFFQTEFPQPSWHILSCCRHNCLLLPRFMWLTASLQHIGSKTKLLALFIRVNFTSCRGGGMHFCIQIEVYWKNTRSLAINMHIKKLFPLHWLCEDIKR